MNTHQISPYRVRINAKKEKSHFHNFSFLLIFFLPHLNTRIQSGWSNWSEWSACSKSCKGIQQRYRQCLTNQQKNSASNTTQPSPYAQRSQQHLCNGYNVEQRECNLFECKGRKCLTLSNMVTQMLFCYFLASNLCLKNLRKFLAFERFLIKVYLRFSDKNIKLFNGNVKVIIS